MGPEMYVGYAKDWVEYDRLCEEYEGICSGCDRLCDFCDEDVWREPVMRIRDAMHEFERTRVTTDLPEAWREPLHLGKDEPSWRIGYIASPRAIRAFWGVNVDVDVEGLEEVFPYRVGWRSFPYLNEILDLSEIGYSRNDWNRTHFLAAKCFAALDRFLDGFDEAPDEEDGAAWVVLKHLVPLSGCILRSGEPWNYRVMYD